MNELQAFVTQIKTKHTTVVEQISAQHTQQLEQLLSLEQSIDEQNKQALKVMGQVEGEAATLKQQLLKEKAAQQEELSSIERLQQDVTSFFEEDWQQLKATLLASRQARADELTKQEARMKKTEEKLKSLQEEKRVLTGQILLNREQNEFDHILEVLSFMPLGINVSKLIQQPKHVRDEILGHLLNEQPLPARLANLV